MRVLSACQVLLLVSCSVTGCDEVDPYARGGVWHPLGANAANLGAMVADQHDLEQGREAATSAGDMAAAAVARLRAGAVKRLPASAISQVRATDTGPPADPGNAATPAAPVSSPPAGASGVAP